MASSTNVSSCSNFTQSHFLQVSKNKVILLEILPFLTQSQRDGGEKANWFTRLHLNELLGLLQQNDLKNCISDVTTESKLNKKPSSKFIVTGTTLRAACIFKKRNGDDFCLIAKKMKVSKNKFQEIEKIEDKLMVHVCPKSNSSVMNLTKMINSDTDKETETNADNEQISKYFQPVTD